MCSHEMDVCVSHNMDGSTTVYDQVTEKDVRSFSVRSRRQCAIDVSVLGHVDRAIIKKPDNAPEGATGVICCVQTHTYRYKFVSSSCENDSGKCSYTPMEEKTDEWSDPEKRTFKWGDEITFGKLSATKPAAPHNKDDECCIPYWGHTSEKHMSVEILAFSYDSES